MFRVLSFTLLLLITACGKNSEIFSDPASVISGRAVYKNRFSSDSSSLIPLSNAAVFIQQPDDPPGSYFLKVMTDEDGRFSVYSAVRPLKIYTTIKLPLADNDSALMFASTTVSTNEEHAINLVAEFDLNKQSIFYAKTYDSEGGILPSATVHLYSSLQFAIQNNPVFAVSTINLNSYGSGFKLNIPPGSYYANASRTIDTSHYSRIGKPITISLAGVNTDSFHLRKSTITLTNGIQFTLKDSLGGTINGADVYLYTSAVLASSNVADGAIELKKSDKSGIVTFYNLPAGLYFLNANKMIADTLIYQRINKTVVLNSTGVVTDTMVLRRKV